MDENRKHRGRVARVNKAERMELVAPDLHTGMLDGYAKAIQEMGQRRRDQILSQIVTSKR